MYTSYLLLSYTSNYIYTRKNQPQTASTPSQSLVTESKHCHRAILFLSYTSYGRLSRLSQFTPALTATLKYKEAEE